MRKPFPRLVDLFRKVEGNGFGAVEVGFGKRKLAGPVALWTHPS